ncbi:unnamed protein product [Effrenium voratum]|uniref:Uncharacterized protein n=1 Tax=Effrenium voratum TaxID=2562239 RepID=A0AA36JG45_9DINO|nr:unnamed protein product [Effrenium voratum]
MPRAGAWASEALSQRALVGSSALQAMQNEQPHVAGLQVEGLHGCEMPRLVALLQKILKALVARAADSLPPPFQVAAGNVAEEAESFRDAFRGFLENYFIDEEPPRAHPQAPRALGGSCALPPASGPALPRCSGKTPAGGAPL